MSMYHRIFIKRAFDTPGKLGVLNKYVYKTQPIVEVKIEPIIPHQSEKVKIDIVEVPQKAPAPVKSIAPEPPSSYFTDKTDTLFWCLYIAAQGHTAYESIGRGYSNVEIAEKQKIVEFVRKNHGIAKTKVMAQEIMSDLMTNKRASLMVLPALAAFYKKHIVITKQNRFYIDIPGSEDSDTLYLIKNDKGNYGIDYSTPTPNLNKLMRLNSYDKPLAAISTYKIGDLTEFAIRVGIDTTVKRNKADLYQAVTIKCLW